MRAHALVSATVVAALLSVVREEDVAEVLSVSVITVNRDWRVARAWLMGRLQSRA